MDLRSGVSSLAISLILVSASAFECRAQQEPVELENANVWDHYVRPVRMLRSDSPEGHRFASGVSLDVIVSDSGFVEWAHATGGPRQFFLAAEAIERDRQFLPFEQEGTPIRARIKDWVSIVPPEQWAVTKVPFPPIKDLNSLRISLVRTSCMGSCPSYSVEVRGTGDVIFRGESDVLITGEHHATISRREVENLLQSFRAADYFSLKDDYSQLVTDTPTYTTGIEFDGHKKSVGDHVGAGVGMPDVAIELEDKIGEIAGTEKWIKETDQTWPALLAEHWNFRAQTDENRELFASVTEKGSADLIQRFLAAGAPALGMGKAGETPLVNAAEKGNLDLVRRMIGNQTHLAPQLLFTSLRAAAHSGNVDLMEFLISKGANVNGHADDPNDKETVLIGAASRCKRDAVEETLRYHPNINQQDFNGNSALARFLSSCSPKQDMEAIWDLLTAAGADVNLKNDQGESPIFSACWDAPAVALLAQAGADLNVKDQFGQTALMRCFGTDFVNAMIAAGADLYVRDRDGHTAAQAAREMGAIDKAQLIESAMKSAKNQ